MAKVELTPAKLAEWKKELRRSIDEQVPLPRCLSTKNMLAMVEEIEFLRRNSMIKTELLGKFMLKTKESDAGQ